MGIRWEHGSVGTAWLDDMSFTTVPLELAGGRYKWDGLYYLSCQSTIAASRPYHGWVVREIISRDFVNWPHASAIGFVRTAQHELPGPGRSREGERNHEGVPAYEWVFLKRAEAGAWDQGGLLQGQASRMLASRHLSEFIPVN